MNIFKEYKDMEYYKIKYRSRYNKKYIFAFVLGFLFIIIVMLSSDVDKILINNQHILLDRDSIKQLSNYDDSISNLYINIFLTRFLQYIFIVILSKSKLKKIAAVLIYFLMGIDGGVLIIFFVYNYGLLGILLLLSLLFPHDIMYFMNFMYIFNNSVKHDTKYYHNVDINKLSRRKLLHRDIKKFLLSNIIFLTGTILEAYVNPIIVKKIADLF